MSFHPFDQSCLDRLELSDRKVCIVQAVHRLLQLDQLSQALSQAVKPLSEIRSSRRERHLAESERITFAGHSWFALRWCFRLSVTAAILSLSCRFLLTTTSTRRRATAAAGRRAAT